MKLPDFLLFLLLILTILLLLILLDCKILVNLGLIFNIKISEATILLKP